MDRGKDWQVTLVEDDALLFHLGSDGTVTMRALPVEEWDALLAENQRGGYGQPVAQIVREIVEKDEEPSIRLLRR
jgi:hypothetical protein